MTAISNQELSKRMLLLAGSTARFKPHATYDEDGDCIEFLAKPDPFYADRIDDLVTVYYSQETHEVIGSLIKGVSVFCKQFAAQAPGFRITIEDGPVRLEHLFLAKLWATKADAHDIKTLAYRKLMNMAEENAVEVDAELCPT